MLTKLEDSIVARILDLLPQQSLFNLALTNYQFYTPCLAHLYKHISIVEAGKVAPHNNRKLNFQTATLMYGLTNVADKSVNLKLVETRLKIFNQAVEINSQLLEYIERLNIFGEFNEAIQQELINLLSTLKSLTKVYIKDDVLRKLLKKRVQFTSIIIDYEDEGSCSDEIEIRCEKNNKLDYKMVKSLMIRNPKFYRFIKSLDYKISPETININEDASNIDFKNIRYLELEVGENTNLNKLSLNINLRQIRKLMIYQSNPYDHNKNEVISVKIYKWLVVNRDEFESLSYFGMIFNTPLKGEIQDDFDGNYLKKIEILVAVVQVINTFKHPVNVVLPNYLEVLTCYEQRMNHIMWNGCKCSHCSVYLDKLDHFIHFHKYFDDKMNFWKDLTNPIVLNNLAQYFSTRYLNTNPFDYLTDIQLTDWDFHKNSFAPIQFQCFYSQTVYESEYNEDGDVWYDCLTEPKDCGCSKLFLQLNICMVHYLQDIMRNIISLSRGDAESREIASENMNDGDLPVRIPNLSINGFQFVFDKELNGTNFFESYYD